jgi:hypothetical protein
MEIAVKDIRCPDKVGGPFTVTLAVTNNSTATAVYGWFTPCPAASLPPGAITLQPLPSSVFPLPTTIGIGATGTVTAQTSRNRFGPQGLLPAYAARQFRQGMLHGENLHPGSELRLY